MLLSADGTIFICDKDRLVGWKHKHRSSKQQEKRGNTAKLKEFLVCLISKGLISDTTSLEVNSGTILTGRNYVYMQLRHNTANTE